jgi:nanoRNase/pAp phosphatase (c-di-AMP/oligoRNAs hydrolase)
MNDFYQASELTKKSQNILISLPEEVDGDNFCGALALFYRLKELGKKVNLASPRFPEKFRFLGDEETFGAPNQNNITISINTKGGRIDRIHYEKDSQELKFYLNLREGGVELENVSFKEEGERRDLTIFLGQEDLSFESRGRDNQTIIVKNSLGSVSGLIKEFLETFGEGLMTGKIATCLLTGLIFYTQNFRSSKINAGFLGEASLLIKKGGDYQEIIKNLYKNNSLSEIKLLGQVFSKLKVKGDTAWSCLSQEDFQKSDSSSKDLGFVLEALKSNFLLPQTIFILWESHQSKPIIKGVFYSTKKDLIGRILENYKGLSRGNGALFLDKENDLQKAEEKLLKLINY